MLFFNIVDSLSYNPPTTVVFVTTLSFQRRSMPTIHRYRFAGEGRFNPVTLGQFDDAISSAIADVDCQVLLLSGEGKNFSQINKINICTY